MRSDGELQSALGVFGREALDAARALEVFAESAGPVLRRADRVDLDRRRARAKRARRARKANRR